MNYTLLNLYIQYIQKDKAVVEENPFGGVTMIHTLSSRRPSMSLRWGSTLLATVLLSAAPGHAQLPGNSWSGEGPTPIHNGQTEGITNNPVAGAINTVAAHPTNSDILYVGSVNGGIWRTTNATSASPTWTRLTSSEASQSIGTIDFDPTDGTNNTLLAGIGRFSSFASVGGSRSGLLRTTDGVNFTLINGGMAGRNIVGTAARGTTLVAAVNIADIFSCGNIGVWRSTNTGVSWTQVLGGLADALASDPSSTTTLYASKVFGAACGAGVNGIFKSTDTGATWAKVSTAAMDALLNNSSGTNVDIVVGNSNNVFVAIVNSGTGAYGGVFRSGNGGTTWTQMDAPATAAGTLHPGTQGGTHTSIAADPTNSNIVYLGGDRQASPFPNPVGAVNFSGNLARGDASLAPGSQWTALTHSGTASNSSPHADSRDMVFTAGGDLIETDDGGIYRRTSPTSATGDWFSLNNNLQVTEHHDSAYDSLNDILIVGNQDVGTAEQTAPLGLIWNQVTQGDGGDVISGPGAVAGQEVRYSSFQNLSSFRRRTFNSSNTLLSTVFPALAGAAFSPQFRTPIAINEIAPNRLIFGGANGVFESLNRGDTISQISSTIVTDIFNGGGAIAAGGTGNADLVYVAGVAGGTSALWARTTSGGAFSNVQTAAGGTAMVGATIDPDDATHGFGLDSANVYRTTNTGTTFSNVTGNLLTLSPGTLRSIEYINSSSGDAVVVGADRGTYIASDSTSFSTWTKFGAGIPNSPVFELTYDSAADVLLAGTMGSGSYRMTSLSDTCAESIALVTGQWKQISLACNPGGSNTVADVFGDDLGGTYDVDWVVFRYDASTQTQIKLATTDTLAVGEGYWIRTNLGSQVVDVSGTDNVVTDTPLTGVLATPPAGCASSAGRCGMAGNPHAYDVCWADVLVDDGGFINDLATVDPGGICQTTGGATCVMSRIGHKWTGSAYTTFDGTTPGMEGTLVPWDAFWISANKPGIELRIPETPGGPGLPCGPPARTSDQGEGWFIRLTAESGQLVDSFNVFGQLPDSHRGYDPHDLQELAPFGTPYLTVVFPHDNWGDHAGDYASDYHLARPASQPDEWRFDVRSSETSAEVTLRWDGPSSRLDGSVLTDVETGEQVDVSGDGSYTFVMNGNSRSFHWVSQAASQGLFADSFESGDTSAW